MQRQHAVVAMWQLEELGYSRWTVARRVSAMELFTVHHGVYAVGHRRLTIKGQFMAAVLACGRTEPVVLSHHAAAALWDLRPNPQGRIDVTAPGKHTHRGVRCHISRRLPDGDRTIIDGIPVTGLERTALDYAEQATPRQLRLALEAAQRRGILHHRKLTELLDRSPGRRGVKPLRAAIAELSDEPLWTQSELEDRFLELIRGARLPVPRTNIVVEGFLVDCAWPEQRLVAELDGYAYHRSRDAFEGDRRRDVALQKAGWPVIRITYRRLHDEPTAVIDDVRAMLAR